MLDKLNNYMEKKYGISMKEEIDSGWFILKAYRMLLKIPSNLLASYIKCNPGDVSVKREYVRRLLKNCSYL